MNKYAIAIIGKRYVVVKISKILAAQPIYHPSAWAKADVLEVVSDEKNWRGKMFKPGTLILNCLKDYVTEFEDDDSACLWFELIKNDLPTA